MVTVNWKEGMVFEGVGPTGGKVTIDTHPDYGGQRLGPTPLEAFLISAASCSAMDVLAILEKKKQVVESYRIEVEGDRAPEGEWPRPYTKLKFTHVVSGPNLDESAVKRAVELSDEKYCSVLATLRFSPPVESVWVVDRTA